MNEHIDRQRREFLRGCGRLLLLAAGAGALGQGLHRGQVAVRASERCDNRGICSGCGRRETCGLPAALSRRRALEAQP